MPWTPTANMVTPMARKAAASGYRKRFRIDNQHPTTSLITVGPNWYCDCPSVRTTKTRETPEVELRAPLLTLNTCCATALRPIEIIEAPLGNAIALSADDSWAGFDMAENGKLTVAAVLGSNAAERTTHYHEILPTKPKKLCEVFIIKK